MLEGLKAFRVADVATPTGARIRVRTAGPGATPASPVVLLHGYPQTSAMWHLVGPELARHHTVVLASVLLLSGCNPPGAPAENFSGLPVADEAAPIDVDPESGGEENDASEEVEEGAPFEESESPQVVWWEQGGQLALVIYGSSTCPSVGRDIRVLDKAGEGNRVAIDLVERPDDEICTMDFVPHTTLFWTPVSVTTTEPLEVEVAGTSVTVPIK